MIWAAFFLSLIVLPFLTLALIRKVKAVLQNRVGPPLLQPLYNIIKLLNKTEVLSEDASWLFRVSAVVNLGVVLAAAALAPWISLKPATGSLDIFVFIYLLATVRFFGILAALDTGSPFGAFSSGREATLSLLVEPAVILALVAPAVTSNSPDLTQVFAFGPATELARLPVWILSGIALFLASIVELSRMPLDDPTTHLELTMVHEAMVIENSGPNLAAVELTYALRMVLLYGLTVQCFLHAATALVPLEQTVLAILSVAGILLLAVATSFMETLMVKLKWTKCPEFIAYALTMGLFACMAALLTGGRS